MFFQAINLWFLWHFPHIELNDAVYFHVHRALFLGQPRIAGLRPDGALIAVAKFSSRPSRQLYASTFGDSMAHQ
jgi:hypothetical protein